MSATGPRATLTSRAPSGMAARKRSSMRWRVESLSGTPTITMSCSGSRVCSSSMPWTWPRSSVPLPAGHPGHGGFERQEPVLDRLAHPAVADDQHPPVREAGGGPGLPAALLLVLQQPRELALAGQDQGQGEFGGGGFVDAGGVGEHPARRQRRPRRRRTRSTGSAPARSPPVPGRAGPPCCPCRAGPRCRCAAGAVPRSGPIRGR